MPKPSLLVAMTAFKGSLTNEEACSCVENAAKQLKYKVKSIPIGDGGRGTIQGVHACFKSEWVTIQATGPMGQPVESKVLCLPNQKAPTTIYIESADTCGHHLVDPDVREPMRASSYGLGETINQSIQRWKGSLKKIFIGLGDSAISDMGMGMLSALGYRFMDAGGKVLWGNAHGLRLTRSIELPDVSDIDITKFTILCDVLNPLLGPDGSAPTFAPQKGASPTQVSLIEEGMTNINQIIMMMNGRNLADEPMTGSSGGLAAAFLAFLNAELVQGSRFFFDWINFSDAIQKADLIITGEGQTDFQTLRGKAPFECLQRVEEAHKKSILISGKLGKGHQPLLKKASLLGCYECGREPSPREALTQKAKELLEDPGLAASVMNHEN